MENWIVSGKLLIRIIRTENAQNGLRVKSVVHPRFWKLYSALPREVQLLADKTYAQWLKDFRYPALHFKPLKRGIWSIRIGAHYRAVGHFENKETFLWTWIGTHEEYNNAKF